MKDSTLCPWEQGACQSHWLLNSHRCSINICSMNATFRKLLKIIAKGSFRENTNKRKTQCCSIRVLWTMKGSQCPEVRKSPPSKTQRHSQGFWPLKQQLGLRDTWTVHFLMLQHIHKPREDRGMPVALHFALKAPKCLKNPRDHRVGDLLRRSRNFIPEWGLSFPGTGWSSRETGLAFWKGVWWFFQMWRGSFTAFLVWC